MCDRAAVEAIGLRPDHLAHRHGAAAMRLLLELVAGSSAERTGDALLHVELLVCGVDDDVGARLADVGALELDRDVGDSRPTGIVAAKLVTRRRDSLEHARRTERGFGA